MIWHALTYVSYLHSPYQVGILGNAADFIEKDPNNSTLDVNMDRRQMMIAFDMRYAVGSKLRFTYIQRINLS